MLVFVTASTGPAGAQPGVSHSGPAAEVRSPSAFTPVDLHGAEGYRNGAQGAQSQLRLADQVEADGGISGKTPIRRDGAGLAPDRGGGANKRRISSPWTTLLTLAAVLIGAALAARVLRRVASGQESGLPDAALEVLVTRKLDAQASIHLVRVGRRVIAVGSSPAGVCPLTEIDDPHEVAALLAENGPQTARGGNESAKLFGGTPLVRRSSVAASHAAAAREETSPVRRPSEMVREARDG
jgi:flagellar biogenesis protein FliO